MDLVISVGIVSMALLELFKTAWRKWVAKDPMYDFSPKFYAVTIPVLNFLLVPGLAFLGFTGYTFPTDWSAWGLELARLLVVTLTGSVVSLLAYNTGYKPFKVSTRTYYGQVKKNKK